MIWLAQQLTATAVKVSPHRDVIESRISLLA